MNSLKLTAVKAKPHLSGSANTPSYEKEGEAETTHVQLTASSELMNNQIPALSIDPQHDMKVVHDSLGNPMLFSIGNDKVLYVILRDLASKTGWSQHDLSTAIAPDLSVTSFEVAQGTDGRLLLALAASQAGQTENTTLYLTPFITNDTVLTDWSKVGRQWVARPFPTAEAAIGRILIGAVNGQSALGIAAVTAAGITEQYMFNTDAGDATWLWKKFPLPENATELLDLAVGSVNGDPGVYALYNTNAGQTLEFTSLPDPTYHKSSRYDFPLPANAAAIVAIPGAGASHDLYAAGDGVYLYKDSGRSAAILANKSAVSGAHELVVKQDETNAAVFVVCGDEKLVHTGGPKSMIEAWSEPLIIQSGVTQISALRNPYKLTNELFLVKGNHTLSYLYQDPVSTIWKETTIDLPSLNKNIEFTSYTTHIALRDANGMPMMNYPVQVTASSWTYVTINGESHSLDPVNPANVKSDYRGNITLINRVSDISTPVFHIQSSSFADVVDIDPASKVREGLKQVQSGSDLRSMRLQDGTFLVSGEVNDATLSSAADAVKQLTTLTDKLPEDGSERKENVSRTATKRASGAPSLAVINAGLLPAGYAWGMTFHDEGATFWKHGDANAKWGVGDFIDAIKLEIGDALEWIEQKISDIGDFFLRVAGDVVEFFIELGKETYKFIINAIETTYRVIHWVLKKTLGIDLDKFVKWLGFLFDWNDIKTVHKALVNMTNQSLNFGKSQIGQLEKTVNEFFEGLKTGARKLIPITDGDQSVLSLKNEFEGGLSTQTNSWMSEILYSPGGNWGQYQLLHSGATEAGGDAGEPSDPFSAFVNDVVWPTLESVETTAQQLFEDFGAMFNDDTLTINQAIQRMTSDAAVGLLDAIQKIVVGVISFVEDLVALIQKGINEKIEIPFFSALYREVADSELSILDAIMLVLAIPTTIAYKLVAGKAPFEEDSVFVNGEYQHIFSMLSGNTESNSGVRTPRASLATGSENESRDKKTVSDEVSPALKVYSHLGGYAYLFMSTVSDTLGLIASITDAEALELPEGVEREEKEKKAAKLEYWRTGLSIGKIPLSYPVGSDEEVTLQRAVWGIYFASPFMELGLTYVLRKLKRSEYIPRAKGVWSILECVTVFVLESLIYDKEKNRDIDDPNEMTDNNVKLAQNCFYFMATGTGGVTAILPKGEAKAILGLLSGGLTIFAGIFNFARVTMNITNDLEHQNF